MQRQKDTCIASLTMTEFCYLLARKRRMELLSALEVQQLFAKFKQDIEDAHLIHSGKQKAWNLMKEKNRLLNVN